MTTVWQQVRGHARLWGRVIALFWRLSPATVGGLVAVTVLVSAVPALQVQLTMLAVQAIADAVQGGATPALVSRAVWVAGAIATLGVLSHIIATLQQYLQVVLQLRLATSVTEQVVAKATRLDMEHFEDDENYDRLQRASRESTHRPYQIFDNMIEVVGHVVSLLAVVAVLFSWNALVATCILLSPLPSLIANMVFGQRGYQMEYDRSAGRRRAAYLQQLVTSDKAFKEVRLFGLDTLFLARYRQLLGTFFSQDRLLARRQSLVAVPLGLLSVLATGGALVYATIVTISSGQVGQFAGFAQAVAAVHSAAASLLFGIGQLYQNTLFIGNLFEFFDLPESQIRSGSRPFPERLRKGIEFRDVTFVYPGTTVTALRNLSCLFPAGKCVAVVGHNGAGKTTLVKLIARLYEPTSGTILIDDVPIEEYDLADLRRNLGVIFQDFVQYEMTARENIGFGRVDRMDDEEQVRRAAAESGADAFLQRLPSGYGTMLGRMFEKGSQLSIGQWQKVALGRAFMRKAPVVILDEPTASIDPEAEADIFGRLRDVARNATAILIAHRFSTVRIADHILVMENGGLIEQGSHAELMRAEGMYSRLFLLQATGYRDDDGTALQSLPEGKVES